ncbi:Na+/H+ antiporter subunit E [Solirubrobacter sp. CPCC 204708]|uniref:Na+/H+ antiporter subunit E n=1 Tax=Solirubrobacter deserti TaxID=2282478 RepID=A0ABT4RVK0_9ACTN|nr:Na+/H+ antiporter subunit E [Solirubrobacter deserti]MBE2321037.1 Na+/H+ antiporter subunit E [Solirubrobacter deserti]MDA0142490.1 Na+/H+ antiporter subunit E [Solirubrobacter deserti]
MIRGVAAAAGLGLLYVLTLASTDPVDLVMGTVVGGALLLALGNRLRPARTSDVGTITSRIAWFPVLIGAILFDVLVGTWDVALRVLHLRPVDRPGIIRVPIGARSERGIAVSALATTLSPGSVFVEVDHERGDLLLHLIDASDPDASRARLQRFYDRYQRRVFP